uniref:Uncharacterized protein n=1 Tax=Plectus sambesii TaxID=2011161 RepID=A0A914WVC9_9BILA
MFAIVLLTVLCGAYLVHNFYWKRRGLPPGPTPWPVVGNTLEFVGSSVDVVAKLLEWKQRYGPVYTLWMGTEAFVHVADYDVMQETFVKNADAFTGRWKNFAVDELRGGNMGIIMSEGSLWKEQRRFSLRVLRDFGVGRSIMEENILAEASIMNASVNKQLANGEVKIMDLKPFIDECIGNIINGIVFGFRLEDEKLKEFEKMKAFIDRQVTAASQMVIFLMGPITIRLPFLSSLWKESKNNFDEMFGYLKRNLNEHRQTFDPDAEPTDFAYAYLKQIHQLQKQGESIENYSDHQMAVLAFDLWGAGLETTITTLRWSMLYMVTNPEVQDKVHAELREKIGDRKEITMADKSSLTYVTAVINEVQRCANILPLNVPHRTLEAVSVGKYLIPEDVVIVPSISVVHMEEKYFPEPRKFKPERFLQSDGKTLKKVDQLMPFSLGKRQCMGESLARMELFLIFANFMHNFHVSIPKGQCPPNMQPINGATSQPHNFSVAIKRISSD